MVLKINFLILFLLQVRWSEPLPNDEFSHDPESNGWTDWSDWSSCSRNCDGGVSRQLRRCRLPKCEGSAVKYKICNMEACSDTVDFREIQCSDFDEDSERTWKPYYHPEEPCALYCVDQTNNTEVLAPKVQDGTRCRPGSLDMCIDGYCQPVGCDLKIGSLKTIDSCGICGGTGNTCSQSIYQWYENINTTCSVKCGGGYKVSQPICQNTVTGKIEDQKLCDISQMPQIRLLECNPGTCPPKWEAGEWSACSQSCGSGIKSRRLYCVEEQNKTNIHVFNPLCKGPKPRMQESCNMQPCPPEWIAGQWSQCSASCGPGTQTRSVTCNKNPLDSLQCDPDKKPLVEQKCVGKSCQNQYFALYDEEPKSSAVFYKGSDFHIEADRLIGQKSVSSHTAVFVTEEWGPCSVTCGVGYRRRKVFCKAHLDYTKLMTKFADDTCVGTKPDEEEPCKMEPCSDGSWEYSAMKEEFGDDNRDYPPKVAPGLIGRKYRWVKTGFTPCTNTCLGGVQELIVNCVRDDDKIVSPYLCDTKTQPAVITQTCNDHPCPPSWNVSDFSACSKTCGMGIRTREVICIHKVTMSNTPIVPNNMCDHLPQPPDRELCNIVDCPTEWHVSNWTKCSKLCGGGLKTREVRCHQITAQIHDVSHPDHICKGPKPMASRPCNTRPCNENTQSSKPVVLSISHQVFNHIDVRDTELTLRIGGQASIFAGTRVRIKCPVKNFPREKIVWLKGDSELHNRGKYKISKKGYLKIMELSNADNTTFTCRAGQSAGTISISVMPSPGKFPPNSEEFLKHNTHLDPAMTMEYSTGNRHYEPSEDISHERVPEHNNGGKYSGGKKKPISTPSDVSPIGATTEDILVVNYGSKQEVEIDSLLSSSSSSASRITPIFFSFLIGLKNLWSLQDSNYIRNHRMLFEDPIPFENGTIDNRTSTESVAEIWSTLRKGDRGNLKFEWFIGQWSNCLPPCSGTGFQIRAAHCMVPSDNMIDIAENKLCEESVLPTSPTVPKCEPKQCPHCIVHEWQDCDMSRCFAWNTVDKCF